MNDIVNHIVNHIVRSALESDLIAGAIQSNFGTLEHLFQAISAIANLERRLAAPLSVTTQDGASDFVYEARWDEEIGQYLTGRNVGYMTTTHKRK